MFGFDIKGVITNENQPLKNFGIELRADSSNPIKSIHHCEGGSLGVLCSIETNSKGEFELKRIPVG